MRKPMVKPGSVRIRHYPNKETLWSYFMQAIEPVNEVINKVFPGYHPMWVIQSQKIDVSADQFKYMRETLLRMTREECAAYLRISEHTVQLWESGNRPVNFIAFELLRLVYESAHFRLSHEDWQGWFINPTGRLVSPDRGNLSFTPADLSYIRETYQAKSFYEAENTRLQAEVEQLRTENAELREAAGDDGLLDELKQIEARLVELSQQVSQKKVVKLFPQNKPNQQTLEAKCA